MPSERVQRQIDRLLDEADEASVRRDWQTVRERAASALAFDPENPDARSYLEAADRGSVAEPENQPPHGDLPAPPPGPSTTQPTSFANGRYEVKRFLGEGGKKKVYLAHDSLLDRDVAFALIKTEGLDEESRTRITREAQAMGRLGDHPNIVTVYDIGSEGEQPYMVLPVLAGGDVEGVIEKAPDQRMPLEQALKIAIETCRGLEFAHGKGIVHRDLKPGNVWLSEDGTAKIGDFGLAVAMDKSRLTQAGMMVGTVSYMPPEQAMGGEVGPRSDLYSLGAMLYEMVCGRPPFVGDESVAIIGQHLNTPPVAPTWHRPDCPPALEALILRLLEKDPSKRPASATEVRQGLEGVSVGTARPRDPTVTTEAPSGADNPLYRRTFVGRENEVKQLQQAFDAAMSGQGGLVMVVGEPGIGKTALCEQLATYVALRGGKALVGHCYEEGSLSLPYLAFVEAMRSYVLAREPDGLRSDLGTGAADVARIVSEVRDRVQGVELRPAGDPEDDRWRLLQSITSFLRNASTVQPLVVVLEDLHWADRGTLDLLLHVARNLQGSRLLIVGNYRDVEVDRTHPLSGVLADLRRINSFASVRLRGLTVDEVHRMYETIRGNAVPWGQAEAVFRATEGNPLFVQEVLRYLVEEGIVVREEGRYVTPGEPGGGIPEGLRDVVGRRLNRLGEQSNRVLSIAAVIGRDFRLDILQQVANASEEEIYSALEEAQERAIIEQRQVPGTVGFRFTHAFFRQTLYEEIFAPRRIRLHQQVGRGLEVLYGRRLEEHAAELAEHFAQSTEAADLEKAVLYSELAARRAVQVFAYGEAMRHLEQALHAQEVLDPDNAVRRCDLLLDLGAAMLPAGEALKAARVVLEEAFTLAEAADDRQRASQSAQMGMEAFERYSGGITTTGRRRWVERADRYAGDGTDQRCRVDLGRTRLLQAAARHKESLEAATRALELARSLGDIELLAEAVTISSAWTPHLRALVRQASLDVWHGPWQRLNSRIQASFLERFCQLSFSDGDRPRMDEAVQELAALASRTRDTAVLLADESAEGLPLLLSGDLEAIVSRGERLVARASDFGNVMAVQWLVSGFYNSYALRQLGLHAVLEASMAESYRLAGVRDERFMAQQPIKVLAVIGSGKPTEARALFEGIWEVLGAEILNWGGSLTLLEAAILFGDVEKTETLLTIVAGDSELMFAINGAAARHLAAGAALVGRLEDARAYSNKAIEVSSRLPHRPELALSRLALAELLLEHYPDEREAAIEHLDFAIGELREMKMQPALERALRHRGLLKA